MQVRTGRGARATALVCADAAALWCARPRPTLLWHTAEHPAAALSTIGADRLVALFAGASVWVAAAWVALALVCVGAGSLPGALGRIGDAVAGVLVPAAVRRLLAVSLGVGLVAAPAYAAVAQPAYGDARTGGVAAGSSWTGRSPAPGWPTDPATGPATGPTTGPTTGSGSTGTAPAAPLPMTPSATTPSHRGTAHRGPAHGGSPDGGRPAGGRPATVPHRTRRDQGSDSVVRVRAGDSLWVIAARRLGGAVTPQSVAAYWPRVYAANRDRIGGDPGLVVPGQLLHLPDPAGSGPD